MESTLANYYWIIPIGREPSRESARQELSLYGVWNHQVTRDLTHALVRMRLVLGELV